ncbi:MAG: hypothetical protein H6707_18735 [Deltaproteobacteria bacterium]|nr:hypothetical protein [Deltaproteobacteria bacterium]
MPIVDAQAGSFLSVSNARAGIDLGAAALLAPCFVPPGRTNGAAVVGDVAFALPTDPSCAGSRCDGNLLWLNADLAGYEYRRGHGFIGFSAGFTLGLAGDYIRPLSDDSPRPVSGLAAPQMRLLGGVRF